MLAGCVLRPTYIISTTEVLRLGGGWGCQFSVPYSKLTLELGKRLLGDLVVGSLEHLDVSYQLLMQLSARRCASVCGDSRREEGRKGEDSPLAFRSLAAKS